VSGDAGDDTIITTNAEGSRLDGGVGGQDTLKLDFSYDPNDGGFTQRGLANDYVINNPFKNETLSAKNFEQITWNDGTVANWNSETAQFVISLASDV